MDAKEVKAALNGRVEQVCAFLLPHGRRDGRFWVCGDSGGAAGASLKVNLDGPYVGCWKDFGRPVGADHGDLLSLWQETQRCSFVDALTAARKFLGMPEPLRRVRPSGAEAARPGRTGGKALVYDVVKEGGEVWRWLTETRKLLPDTIRKYRVGEAKDAVVFPFFDAEGRLVRLKFRGIESKNMWQWPPRDKAAEYEFGEVKCLWGWQVVGQDAQQVAVTEGEIDAMSYFQETGIPALSLPEGAQVKKNAAAEDISKSHSAWIEHDTPALERFSQIDLCFDMDEPGQLGLAAVAPRLGRHRVRLARIAGAKDANEVLMAGGDLLAALSFSELLPENLKRPMDFEGDVWNEFFPEGGAAELGDAAPWTMPFRFRPGELTVWHGWNGSGKTVCLTYTMVNMAASGRRCCIASMEMPARKTFRNAARMAMGHGHPAGGSEDARRADLRAAMRWLDQSFFVYDKLGEVSVRDVLDVFTYCFRRYGVEHFVLDSLMMLRGQEQTDHELYSAQRDVVKDLKAFAVENRVHVHLVCHSKKPDSKKDHRKCWPDKFEISGSGNLSNIADNVVCVWRNELKENAIADAYEQLKNPAVQHDMEQKVKWQGVLNEAQKREDSLFVVQKQRETGEMPKKRLYFDFGTEGSWQYLEEPNKDVLRRRFCPAAGVVE